MTIDDRIHPIRIDFSVTEQIKRFVYVYLIEGKQLYLIDSGVRGSDRDVADCVQKLGRNIEDIAGIFLTHSHPDHIGGAAAIKKASGCLVYSSAEEKPWIEDIDLQNATRPVPNFHTLVDKSVPVDKILKDGDIVNPEPGISLRVMETKGHSQGSLCYLWEEQGVLFTGDAIPVVGDVPIYDRLSDSIDSLEKLRNRNDIRLYLSAWDDPCDGRAGQKIIARGIDLLQSIRESVTETLSEQNDTEVNEIIDNVCKKLSMEKFSGNPLFKRSIAAAINEITRKGK